MRRRDKFKAEASFSERLVIMLRVLCVGLDTQWHCTKVMRRMKLNEGYIVLPRHLADPVSDADFHDCHNHSNVFNAKIMYNIEGLILIQRCPGLRW